MFQNETSHNTHKIKWFLSVNGNYGHFMICKSDVDKISSPKHSTHVSIAQVKERYDDKLTNGLFLRGHV